MDLRAGAGVAEAGAAVDEGGWGLGWGGEGSHALLPEASRGCGDFWRQAPCCLSKAVSVARHLHGASPAGALLGSAQASFLGQTGCFEPEGRTKKLQRNQGDGVKGKPGLSLGGQVYLRLHEVGMNPGLGDTPERDFSC